MNETVNAVENTWKRAHQYKNAVINRDLRRKEERSRRVERDLPFLVRDGIAFTTKITRADDVGAGRRFSPGSVSGLVQRSTKVNHTNFIDNLLQESCGF